MQRITSRLTRLANAVVVTSLAVSLVGAKCGSGTEVTQDIQGACKAAGDASKDFNDFRQDYPANLPAARVALANMQSSLTAAGHAAAGDASGVFDAIQSAQRAVDKAQQALDAGQPVDTNAIGSAMDALGNQCSQALGG